MRHLLLYSCAVLALAAAASAQAPKAQGFDDFKLIKTRNVFDPSRRAARTEMPREARTASPRIARSNTLSLTGTMSTDGRTVAFFGGSRSEYSKVLGIGGEVAEYKVKSIGATQVELERDGKTIVLALGKFLTIDGRNATVSDVAPSQPEPAPESTPPADGEATSATPSTTAPPVITEKNDVLRRMMEKRAKELAK